MRIMTQLLNLSRAARLAGITRSELQKSCRAGQAPGRDAR